MCLLLTSPWTYFMICKCTPCCAISAYPKLFHIQLKIILFILFPPSSSYLVMPFMGTDLGKLMKLHKLSEDKIQYLVYQMLKGLKVKNSTLLSCVWTIYYFTTWLFCWLNSCFILLLQYIHSAGIIHRVSCLLSFHHICMIKIVFTHCCLIVKGVGVSCPVFIVIVHLFISTFAGPQTRKSCHQSRLWAQGTMTWQPKQKQPIM